MIEKKIRKKTGCGGRKNRAEAAWGGATERRIAGAIHHFNESDDDRNNRGAASALKSIARFFMAL